MAYDWRRSWWSCVHVHLLWKDNSTNTNILLLLHHWVNTPSVAYFIDSRYVTVIYHSTMHTAQQLRYQNFDQTLHSRMTSPRGHPIHRPWCELSGVFREFFNDRNVLRTHCTGIGIPLKPGIFNQCYSLLLMTHLTYWRMGRYGCIHISVIVKLALRRYLKLSVSCEISLRLTAECYKSSLMICQHCFR